MVVQGTAVTHTNDSVWDSKNSTSVSWTAPMMDVGAVTFRYVAMLGLAYFGMVWPGFAWLDSLAGLGLIWLDSLARLGLARQLVWSCPG